MSFKIGAHMSVSGGIHKSFERSFNIGGNSLQIFAKSPRGRFFGNDTLDSLKINEILDSKNHFNQQLGVIHSVYLVNLAKPFDEAEKDIKSVVDDFLIAEKIGFNAVNVHLGKYGSLSKQEAIDNMCFNVGKILDKVKNINAYFVFENTAGQGSEIGWQFEELGYFYNYLINKLGSEIIKSKIRFCFDTAHGFGAGYDLLSWDKVLSEYDKYIGLQNLYCFHLNDSKAPIGSKLDRHASIGYGFIGLIAISGIIKRASQNNIPLILETPEEEKWSGEIELVKSIAIGSISEEELINFHKNNFKTQSLKKFDNQKQDSLF